MSWPLSSGARKIDDGAVAADEVPNFREISPDIGDEAWPVGNEREEGIIKVVSLEHVTLFAAGDDIFGSVLAPFQ